MMAGQALASGIYADLVAVGILLGIMFPLAFVLVIMGEKNQRRTDEKVRDLNAELSEADLRQASLRDTDFAGAVLRGTHLSGLRLTEAHWEGTRFAWANLARCDFEGMTLRQADFEGANLTEALLTGTTMRESNFRHAKLCGAKLAEVDWEGACLADADLTGATFHMGTTRSGLVGSPIASEGSRTGFYTDDYDEQSYKSPEEIRKANLCGADLRGARLDGVDFYLVDLRGALYDAGYECHLHRCGAILESPCE